MYPFSENCWKYAPSNEGSKAKHMGLMKQIQCRREAKGICQIMEKMEPTTQNIDLFRNSEGKDRGQPVS